MSLRIAGIILCVSFVTMDPIIVGITGVFLLSYKLFEKLRRITRNLEDNRDLEELAIGVEETDAFPVCTICLRGDVQKTMYIRNQCGHAVHAECYITRRIRDQETLERKMREDETSVPISKDLRGKIASGRAHLCPGCYETMDSLTQLLPQSYRSVQALPEEEPV